MAILRGIHTHEVEEDLVDRQFHNVIHARVADMAVDAAEEAEEVVADNCCRCEAEEACDDNGYHTWV